jgi:hypothetical protein
MSALSSPAIPPAARRRVWPVAAAGVAAAAIGLPLVFLHGGHAGAPTATPPAPATNAPKSAPAVTPHAATTHVVHAAPRTGHLGDPFGRVTAPAKTTSATTSPASSSHATATPSTSSRTQTRSAVTPTATTPTVTPTTTTPTVTPTTTTPTVTPTTTTPNVTPSTTPNVTPTTVTPTVTTPTVTTPHVTAPVHPWHVYRADVRVSPAGSRTLHRHLRRLTALPSSKTPFVVFLGAVHGGHRAAFVLNRLATASGAGRCAKFDGPYQALYLKPGQTERVTIQILGAPVTYRVGVVHVKGRHASSAHAARVANHHTSANGAALLRRYGLLGSTHFSGTSGVLPAPKHTHACG